MPPSLARPIVVVSLLGATPALAARDAVIELYTAYGEPGSLVVSGRVIVDKKVRLPAVHRSAPDNLIDTMKVLDSDEIEGARVEVRVGKLKLRAPPTDDDGYFTLKASALAEDLPVGDQPFTAVLVGIGKRGPRARAAKGTLRILPKEPCVVVVSDYDDTVVASHVRDKLRMGVTAVFMNASQLAPVPGVAVAYRRALESGARGLFYLSGSPTSFAPRITHFLEKNRIPTGPLLLKDFGQEAMFQQEAYKRRRLEELLLALPHARFVLVGDSGERDPEIYAGLRRDHEARVVGIVIRRVPEDHDSPPERFRDMSVVSAYDEDLDVVARLVARALAPPRE